MAIRAQKWIRPIITMSATTDNSYTGIGVLVCHSPGSPRTACGSPRSPTAADNRRTCRCLSPRSPSTWPPRASPAPRSSARSLPQYHQEVPAEVVSPSYYKKYTSSFQKYHKCRKSMHQGKCCRTWSCFHELFSLFTLFIYLFAATQHNNENLRLPRKIENCTLINLTKKTEYWMVDSTFYIFYMN